MRLPPNLVLFMADSVVGELLSGGLIEMDDRDRIARIVENVVLDDLEAEERLEEEARELINRHYEQMRAEGAEYYVLLRKVKEKLARDKGMIL